MGITKSISAVRQSVYYHRTEYNSEEIYLNVRRIRQRVGKGNKIVYKEIIYIVGDVIILSAK